MTTLVACFNPSTAMFKFLAQGSGSNPVPDEATAGAVKAGLNVSVGPDTISIKGIFGLDEGKVVAGSKLQYEINNSGSVLLAAVKFDTDGTCPT